MAESPGCLTQRGLRGDLRLAESDLAARTAAAVSGSLSNPTAVSACARASPPIPVVH